MIVLFRNIAHMEGEKWAVKQQIPISADLAKAILPHKSELFLVARNGALSWYWTIESYHEDLDEVLLNVVEVQWVPAMGVQAEPWESRKTNFKRNEVHIATGYTPPTQTTL